MENSIFSNENSLYEKLNRIEEPHESRIDSLNSVSKMEKFKNLPRLSKFCYIMAKSNIPSLKYRILFGNMDRTLQKEYPLAKIYKDYSLMIQNKIRKTENEINSFVLSHAISEKNLLQERFKLSKTAQNCLNFITSKEEENLTQLFYDNGEVPYLLVNIVKIIYILIDRDYCKLPDSELMKNLVTNIFPEFNVNKLSKLLIL